MRSILAVIFFLGSVVVGRSQTNDWSKRIVSKTERPLASFIFAHTGEVNVLIIDGKRFEHVRGVDRFYLLVPKTNALLFVVNEEPPSVTYHVFNMDTDEDIAIPAGMSVFGACIGIPNSCDTIEVTEDGKLVLCDRGEADTIRKSLVYIDLKKRAVVAEKTLLYDKAGKLIHEQDSSPPF
jgi:hypothetical protein